jgi:hypothetical protein
MRYLIWLLFFMSSILSANEIKLIDSNARLLCVGKNGEYIVYAQLISNRHGEYTKVKVFIYDTKKQLSKKLNNKLYILEYLKVFWTDDGHHFFISDGEKIESYNFVTNERNEIFKTQKEEIIYNFCVSSKGNKIVIDIKNVGLSPNIQHAMMKDIINKKNQSIYEVVDSSVGEFLVPGMKFSANDNAIFINDIDGRLIFISLINNKVIQIDSMVSGLFFADSNNVYYLKTNNGSNHLYRYNMVYNSYFDIMSEKEMRIDFIGDIKYENPSIAISMNDNVFIYNDQGNIIRLDLPRTGRYLFVNNKFSILEEDKKLIIISYSQ